MKKFGLIVFVGSLLAFGCLKGDDSTVSAPTCTPEAESVEIPSIDAYVAKDSVPFTQDPTSGVFYHITAPGSGLSASVYSDIFFTYNATLLDGTSIGSSSTTVEQPMSSIVPGIQAMAGYLKTGAKIQMIVPSSLAYGCQPFSADSVTVPANSVVVFNLNINNIQ